MRSASSTQIGHFIGAVSLLPDAATGWRVRIDEIRKLEIDFLKHLVWKFVITNRRLATVQAGHKRILCELVRFYYDALGRSDLDVLPPLFRDDAEQLGAATSDEAVRLAIDMVASLADEQATRLGRRISGLDVGSIHDRVDA
jgi:dGTP triphosphohydrolase